MLLDPDVDDPLQHLTIGKKGKWRFRIAPRNGSKRGRKTIDITKLNRDDLCDKRKKFYFDFLKPIIGKYQQARRKGDSQAVEAQRQAAIRLIQPSCEFSFFAREIFRRYEVIEF